MTKTILFAGGHTASNAPDLFRPPKLSGAGPGWYWGGGPPGKTSGCCQLFRWHRWCVSWFRSRLLELFVLSSGSLRATECDVNNSGLSFCVPTPPRKYRTGSNSWLALFAALDTATLAISRGWLIVCSCSGYRLPPFSLAPSTTQAGKTRVDLVALLFVPSQNRRRNLSQTGAAQ